MWSRRDFLARSASAGMASVPLVSGLTARASARPRERVRQDDELVERLQKIPAEHPRLHFTDESLSTLREHADTTHRFYARRLLDWVDRHRNWEAAGDPGEGATLEQSAAYVTSMALAYVIGQREEDLETAREWTLNMATYPERELREYNLGVYAAGLARSYDWLYDHWSSDERSRIQEHLAFLIRQVYRGSFRDKDGWTRWWANKPLHHDYWIPVGGYGEAALALLGEVDEAAHWAGRAKSLFDMVFTWLGDDGAWHEGVADWCYAMAPLLWFYGGWETAVGDDLHQDHEWIRNTARYRLYHWLPDDTYVYLNDSFRSGRYGPSGTASAHLLRRLASLYDDGHAQWLADRDEPLDLQEHPANVYQAPYESSSYQAERRQNVWSPALALPWSLVWYDPSVSPIPPDDLPLTHRFENMDVAIIRTGWNDDEAVVSFACGPLGGHRMGERARQGEEVHPGNVSHGHADYNSITLFANGRYYIVPPSYARRASYFQNTMAVNSADLLADLSVDVHIDGLVQDGSVTYARGDATAAFLSELDVERFQRHLLQVDRALVVIDDVRLGGSRHPVWNHLQWNLHHDPREHRMRTSGTSAGWMPRDSDEPQLSLELLAPQGFSWERGVLEDRDGIGMLERLRVIRPEWYDDRLVVVGVLSWDLDLPTPELAADDPLVGVRWSSEVGLPALLVSFEAMAANEVRTQVGKLVGGPEAVVFGSVEDDPTASIRVNAN